MVVVVVTVIANKMKMVIWIDDVADVADADNDTDD